MAVKRAPGGAVDKADAVTPEQTRPIKRTKVQTFLSKAADGCGSSMNSVLVVLGDKFDLYKTGQYSSDMEEPIAKIDLPPSCAVTFQQFRQTRPGLRREGS